MICFLNYGNDILVPVPSPIVLRHQGATLPLTITHPASLANQVVGNASIIPSKAVSGAHNQQLCPVYFAQIVFNWGATIQIPLVGLNITNIDCLIGRDIMAHWHFTYNGKNGTITICD